MSKPSFSNIDLWLFEYAEGNLNPEQAAQLELFILEHPELDIDRDMWEMSKVDVAPVAFPDEDKLYRRKPVYGYFGAGVAAISMLLLISSYYWLNDSKLIHGEGPQAGNSIVNSSDLSSVESELKAEIEHLKILVTSLETQLQSNENSVRTTSNTYATSYGNDSGELNDGNDIASNELVRENTSNSGLNGTGLNSNPSTVTTRMNQGILSNSSPLTQVSPLIMNLQQNNDNEANQSTLSNREATSSNEELESENTTQIDPIPLDEMAATQTEAFNNTKIENTSSSVNIGVTSNYQYSFKYRFSKAMRNLQRMMDNPIALKNYRDPFYHVPGTITTDLNFGATGTVIAPRVQTMSRLQWQGTDQEMFSNQIAVDGYSYGLRGGIGLQLSHDYYNNGGIQNSELAVTYSPKISVNRKISVEPAVRFKMGNKLLNASRMEGQSQVEMMAGNVIDYYADGASPIGRKLWYKDLGFGLNVNTEWFYASAQVDNVFQHRDNMYSTDSENKRRAGTHFVATIGTDWESKKASWETERGDFGMSPYLVYRKFEDIDEVWAGANFRCYWLTLGAAVSTNLDPAASLGVKFENFSLMYNADYLRSGITEKRSLSHQLTLRITGKPNRMGQRFLNQ